MLTNGWLQLGDGINFGNAEFDALITSKAPFTGKANWTQLIRRDNSNPLCFGLGPCHLGSTGGLEILDSTEFYNDEHSDILPRGSDPNPRGWVSFWDNPGVQCIFNFSLHDRFRTYLRFKPDGDGNIWITLGVVRWAWGGTKDGSTITNPTTDGPAFEDTDAFPSWDVRIYEILP